MGVVHNLQIVPKSNTKIKLEIIKDFIGKLVNDGHIEKEYTIWTGTSERIKEVNHYDFYDWSVLSDVRASSSLERITELDKPDNLEKKNYIFKIHVSRKSKLFQNLEVFVETNFQHFPIFILFFHESIDYIVQRDYWGESGHIDEQIVIKNINCIIISSGRNLESSYGLDKVENFTDFYDYVRGLFGEFEVGVYYT